MVLTVEDSLKEHYTVRADGQCGEKAYRRTVTREANDDGKLTRLIEELQRLADEHKMDMDEMLERYQGCNANKRTLRKHLEGKYQPWTEQESQILRNKDELGMKMLLE